MEDSLREKNGIIIFNLHNRHLHREANGYWPAYFPARKLVRDGNIIIEKAFWKVFFAARDIKEVEEFWLSYFLMITNLKEYFF